MIFLLNILDLIFFVKIDNFVKNYDWNTIKYLLVYKANKSKILGLF